MGDEEVMDEDRARLIKKKPKPNNKKATSYYPVLF